ncbi:MAG: winged helix-turn-helix transcriptional regulator [bacterium]|nr:winged helix-turn-helix transcriptional regulator [bacterium]
MQALAREKGVPIAFVDGIRPDLTPDRILHAIKEELAASETLSGAFDDFERAYQEYLTVQQVLNRCGGVQTAFDVMGNIKDPAGFARLIDDLGQTITENTRQTVSNRFALERYLRGVERALTRSLSSGLEAAVEIEKAAYRSLALVIDTYEELEGLDDWVCRALIPALPEGIKVVVLGRNALPKINFDWGEFGPALHVMELPELPERDTKAYLTHHDLHDPVMLDQVYRFTGGYPLLLVLAVHLQREAGGWPKIGAMEYEADRERVATKLLERILREERAKEVQIFLEKGVVARWFNPEVVGVIMGVSAEQGHAIYNKLERHSFIERHPYGLKFHDKIRELLLDRLKFNQPEYKRVVKCLTDYYAEKAGIQQDEKDRPSESKYTINIQTGAGVVVGDQAQVTQSLDEQSVSKSGQVSDDDGSSVLSPELNERKRDVEQDRYAPTYRAAEIRQVMQWIEAGQSACLIGLRGAGKSNFLRYMLRRDVQQRYQERDDADFVFVLVDLLALTKRSEWAVYELILNRLTSQLAASGIEATIIAEITSHHQETIRSRDSFTAQRAFERCVDLLCQRPARRVVLLLDEFDAVFWPLDPFLFRCLRAVRDAHKGQVSYIVVTDSLTRLQDDLVEAEHFYRLVERNVCGLGPYDPGDAQQMVHYLAGRRSIEISASDTDCLIELCGGHAGLLKSSLSLFWDVYQAGDLSELLSTLANEPVLQSECQKMWQSLSEREKSALCALASGAQAAPGALYDPKLTGLIREDGEKEVLFCPLFTDFVRQQIPPEMQRTLVGRSPAIVIIDGQRVDTLTELEFELLCYLYENRGRVCTKDELITNVYRQQYDRMRGGVTDETLQKLISRLRTKIEPDNERPRYIVTVRGEGYRFVEAGER